MIWSRQACRQSFASWMETQLGMEIHPELRFEIGAFQGVVEPARRMPSHLSNRSAGRSASEIIRCPTHPLVIRKMVCLTCKAGGALGAVVSASRLHRVGRGFESLSAHQSLK